MISLKTKHYLLLHLMPQKNFSKHDTNCCEWGTRPQIIENKNIILEVSNCESLNYRYFIKWMKHKTELINVVCPYIQFISRPFQKVKKDFVLRMLCLRYFFLESSILSFVLPNIKFYQRLSTNSLSRCNRLHYIGEWMRFLEQAMATFSKIAFYAVSFDVSCYQITIMESFVDNRMRN